MNLPDWLDQHLDRQCDRFMVRIRGGWVVFYPLGLLGRGRILTNREQERLVRKRLRWLYIGTYGFSGVLLTSLRVINSRWFLSSRSLLLIIVGAIAGFPISSNLLLRGLEPTPHCLGRTESFVRLARNQSAKGLLFAIIFAALCAIILVWSFPWLFAHMRSLWAPPRTEDYLLSGLLVVLSAFAAIIGALGLYVKLSSDYPSVKT